MTSEELQRVLDAHDAEACLALFADATEAERRSVAKLAAKQLRKVTAGVSASLMGALPSFSDQEHGTFFPESAPHRSGVRAAQTAVLATATLAELRKWAGRCIPPPDDALAVLKARRPQWVGQWAEIILTSGGVGAWGFVRRLVREGLCERLHGPLYIHGMILSLLSASPEGSSLRDRLLEKVKWTPLSRPKNGNPSLHFPQDFGPLWLP